jgi:hypothetical protein
MPPFAILQVTAAYSNAVLVAIMPHISNFAKALDLPIPQPVTMAQVAHFGCSPLSEHIGGGVALTNGYWFAFDGGRVDFYRSPRSYYSLQDPSRIPEFYGPVKITQKQAIQIAHDAIKKLGYTDGIFYADRAPVVTPPEKVGTNYIPRYRIEWADLYHDPVPGVRLPDSIEMEVDATTGQIQMLHLSGRIARQPDPKISVHPPVLALPPQSELIGGTKVTPVSKAYGRAFLIAILPQLDDFVKQTGVGVRIPISLKDVDIPDYACGLIGGRPHACIYLKTSDRFWYEHGQITAFEAPNSMRWSAPNKPLEDKPHEKFYGRVNMTTNEAIVLARKIIVNLGYSLKILDSYKPLRVTPPYREGTNYVARIFLGWWDKETEMDVVEVEFNATTKQLESFHIDDDNITNIWREPPKISVPISVQK